MKADGSRGESGQKIWYSFFIAKSFVYAAQSLLMAGQAYYSRATVLRTLQSSSCLKLLV